MDCTIKTKDGKTVTVDRIVNFGEIINYMAIAGNEVYIKTLCGEYELITPVTEIATNTSVISRRANNGSDN